MSSIHHAYQLLTGYLLRSNLATYDIFDYMAVPWISRLFLRRRHGGRLVRVLIRLVQLSLLLAPCTVRRILGVRPCVMSGGIAFYVDALCEAYRYSKESSQLQLARQLLDRLSGMNTATAATPCWGFPFAWPRDELVPPDTPIAYTTVVCGLAWLHYHEITGDAEAARWTRAVCASLLTRFNICRQPGSAYSIGYTALDTSAVVNVSVLAGMYLLSAGDKSDAHLQELAAGLIKFTLDMQKEDGSWPYSTTEQFVDNSHTAMVLQALALSLPQLAGHELYEPCICAIRRGWVYFRQELFTVNGMPKMDCRRNYPLDIGSVAESISAFSALKQQQVLCHEEQQYLDQLWRSTILWAITVLQGYGGSFAARWYPPIRMQLYSLRWGNAQALRALAMTLSWQEQEAYHGYAHADP